MTIFVALTRDGLATARRAAAGAPVHGLAGRTEGADLTFTDTATHLRRLFAEGTPIVGVCAAGILIRVLAPLLTDKHAEPPVLALAEDGSAVVPLLGGHHGANDLARTIASRLGIAAAITTAGDLGLGVALDEPPPGWRLADPAGAKAAAARLLAGAPLQVEGLPWLAPRPGSADAAPVIARASVGTAPADLVYRPAVLAVGVGCERGADPAALRTLVTETLESAGLAPGAVALVASIDVKMDEPAVHAAAGALDVPARFFTAGMLERQTPRLATPSDAVYRAVGCHGVAEAAALAAAGPASTLVVTKRKGDGVTCAIAQAHAPIDPAGVGHARGRLAIVGIGPGTPAWRTPAADAALAAAEEVVGYSLYLDLLGPAIAGKHRHDSPLGDEEVRVRLALDRAAAGHSVALVSSGDAGIYAMATLAFELIEREDRPDWQRLDIDVEPGISAMQAAAARAGAPLGHDFCAISLSDLLTQWDAIERRVRAAAEGDFVIAFYNPVSRRRTTQLAAARAILLDHRPAATPVVLARNLGRAEERVEVTTLDALDPAAVDMLTLVLVGASTSRAVPRGDGGRWVYTPRGYDRKVAP